MTLASRPPRSWLRSRWIIGGAIALIVLIGLTLIAAPNIQDRSGSTFNRAPDGYGAWYAYMQNQGTPIQRWQRPFSDLDERLRANEPITLLQVNSSTIFYGLSEQEKAWIERGNRLVILGAESPVTQANFSTIQTSPVGAIKIDTRRRFEESGPSFLEGGGELLLGDRFGSLVWALQIGAGEVIYSVTPHFAANAYQDEPGNYPFLARLVTEGDRAVWVDEYIHGYKEEDVITEELGGESWTAYLATTPLLPILFQVTILLIVFIWANNQRFGYPVKLIVPAVDNSKAYIEALAGVLQKAETTEFIVDAIGKEEQIQLQKSLGLSTTLLAPQSLIDEWTNQTKRPAADLERAFRPYWQKRRLTENDLKTWLATLRSLQRDRPS